MELTIDFWTFMAIEAALIVFFLGVIAALARMLVHEFDRRLTERFAAQEEVRAAAGEKWDQQFRALEASYRKLDTDVHGLKLELAKEYVRREDAIRDQTVIQAKLDAVYSKVELLTHVVANRKEPTP